jgi:hypothetical protein
MDIEIEKQATRPKPAINPEIPRNPLSCKYLAITPLFDYFAATYMP